MKKFVKDAWVNALRSGKYKQGFGALKPDKDCFCALGVLCDLGSTPWEYDHYFNEWVMYNTSTNLPYKIRRLAGLNYSEANKVARMNDCHNKSFEEIADWIEENL